VDAADRSKPSYSIANQPTKISAMNIPPSPIRQKERNPKSNTKQEASNLLDSNPPYA